MPIRRSKLLDKINTQVIVTGLVISLVAGIVVVPRIMKSPHGAGTLTFSPGATNTGGIVPSNIDWQSARDDKVHVPVCLNRSVEVCVAVRGKKGGITLVGDSHARMLIPAFTRIAKRKGLTLSIAVMPDCPWQIGLQYVLALGVVHECEKRKADWYGRVIPQLDPDIVVLVNRAFDTSVQPLPLVGPKGEIQPHTSVYLRTIAGATAATVKQLRDAGHNVVMIEPVTVAPFDTLSCLSGAKTVDACRFIASARPTGVERYYRSIADNKHVWSIDIDRLVCPYLPICDPIVNGIVVRRDNSHITAQFSESISNQLQTLLEQEGVFGG